MEWEERGLDDVGYNMVDVDVDVEWGVGVIPGRCTSA